MSRHDIINNNLVYKTNEGNFVFTNSKNMPNGQEHAMVRILGDKGLLYVALGTVSNVRKNIYRITVTQTKQNNLFPKDPPTILLSHKKDLVQEIAIMDPNASTSKFKDFVNKLLNRQENNYQKLYIGLYNLLVDKQFLLTPEVQKVCKDCRITLGILDNLCNTDCNIIPETLSTLGRRGQLARLPRRRQALEPPPSYTHDYDNITGGSSCGKKTKSGKACKNRGKCPYH